jgi:hypothetical protein
LPKTGTLALEHTACELDERTALIKAKLTEKVVGDVQSHAPF